MPINIEQQKRGLEQIRNIRRKHFSNHSAAADWWDKLNPEWRGVVLHAAAVATGSDVFKAHLSKCCWRELFEGLDYRAMIHLRQGISRARLTFDGFGSLCDSDFSKRSAKRPIKKALPIHSNNRPQMIIAPHIVQKMQQQEFH